MQTTSLIWESLAANTDTQLESKVEINGVEYSDTSTPVISRSTMQDSLSVGNVVSANLQFAMRIGTAIAKSAEVNVKQRLRSQTGVDLLIGLKDGEYDYTGQWGCNVTVTVEDGLATISGQCITSAGTGTAVSDSFTLPAGTYKILPSVDDYEANFRVYLSSASGHSPIFYNDGNEHTLNAETTVFIAFQFQQDNFNVEGFAPTIVALGTDGTLVSEWLPCGTFYISKRTRDAISGLTTYDCYDAMLKANIDYQPSVYGLSMADVVNEIAGEIGVDVDARTVIKTGADYIVPYSPTVTTMRDILSGIAAAHGGNFIITPENKLRLVPVANGIDEAADDDFTSVLAVLESCGADVSLTVSGLVVTDTDSQTIYGDDTGALIDITSPYLTSSIIGDLQADLLGQTYQSFDVRKGIYNPAIELGDYVKVYDKITSVICNETINLGVAFYGNIVAPVAMEIEDEYPYNRSVVRTLEQAIAYTDKLDESLDQISVFNRLTNNGASQGLFLDPGTGELYINARYIGTNGLSVEDIRAGLIHSADYTTQVIPYIYPASTLYPASNVHPNNGETVTKGFAIDFATGQIYGGFYSEQIAQLQNALVYPKDAPSRSRGGAEEESEER